MIRIFLHYFHLGKMDQIFDTDAPGCVNFLNPLGPGVSGTSATNLSENDAIERMINYNDKNTNNDNNNYDNRNNNNNDIKSNNDDKNDIEKNSSNSYDYCDDDIEKDDKKKFTERFQGSNNTNNDNNNDNNNNISIIRDRIDLMTMNPMLANVFEEDEDDNENIDLA